MTRVHVLLAVWGESFINDFIALSLPSLLAPGNLPALAANYKTRFVFLTRPSDVTVFEQNLAFQKLKEICEIEFLSIQDLIVFGNYSTTLTLAYDRAIKNTGTAMLDTYFIFLVSDYIMADGSMQGLMRYMAKGYSGICAGNFQVIEEEIKDNLLGQINTDTHTLTIKPRELLKQSLEYLHPITIASIYNQTFVNNYHANRFFLRHRNNILAGRFYLLHMLCIKPETLDYQIGSSCDYSFIPEMCPSGNIGIINDSDDYLVIEIQSRQHELDFVNWGPYFNHRLVSALAEWTTKRHRENSKTTIYFHTTDIHQQDRAFIENELNTFINNLNKGLNKYKVHPYRDHPYWHGAIKSLNKQKTLIMQNQEYDYLDLSMISECSLPKRVFYKVFGTPPGVFRWHPRWREYNTIMNFFRKNITSKNNDKTLILYDAYNFNHMNYRSWLSKALNVTHHYLIKPLANNKNKILELRQQQFTQAIIITCVENLEYLKNHFSILKQVTNSNCKLNVLVVNQFNQFTYKTYNFKREYINKMNCMILEDYQITEVATINNNLTHFSLMGINKLNSLFSHSKKIRFLSYIVFGIPCSFYFLIRNLLPKFIKSKFEHCTNIILTVKPEPEIDRL